MKDLNQNHIMIYMGELVTFSGWKIIFPQKSDNAVIFSHLTNGSEILMFPLINVIKNVCRIWLFLDVKKVFYDT